jgi:hypothetical protein
MKRDLIKFLGAALIAVSLAGCVEDNTSDPSVKVAFAVVTTGQFSGIESERLEVIRDPDDFSALWLIHANGVQPDIDFDQNMVVAAFLGERPTGGFTIAITEVEERGDSLLVKVRATFPGDNCIVTQAFSQPHQIITMAQTEKMVVFSTDVERVDCPL